MAFPDPWPERLREVDLAAAAKYQAAGRIAPGICFGTALAFVLACATNSAINQRMAAGRIQRMAAVRYALMQSMAECTSF